METINDEPMLSIVNHVTAEDVKLILTNYGYANKEVVIENYIVQNASNKMLGFLSDYWKVKVAVFSSNERKLLTFFIKAVSRTNAAKAKVVRELNLFEKEYFFYSVIKNCIEVPGLKPWSAKFVTSLDDAMVFEDLNGLQYKLRNKFERFDTAHTLQALNALARFHASSIIFEERRSKELHRVYTINEEYEQNLDEGGYILSDSWCFQCMNGALEAVRTYSKYRKDPRVMSIIESSWTDVWSAALRLSDFSSVYRNVICHRDLWNNNILFHYKEIGGNIEPDDCVMVDFQAIKCQPPAGDVMLLLYCNLNPKFREENMAKFLSHYHHELQTILCEHGIRIDDILTKEDFLVSTEQQRQWGLVVCACLMPQFWVNDDLTTKIFSDTAQFDEILSKDKGAFIQKMMETNNDYRKNVMEIFEEMIERYCLQANNV